MKKHVAWSLCGSLLFALILTACGNTTADQISTTNPSTVSRMHKATATPPPPKPTMATASDSMTESLKNLSGKEFEVMFLQEMIVHHQTAVDMATMVPTHTKRAELKTLAENIIGAQEKEIREMTTWLDQWYQEKPVADAMQIPGMMAMVGHLETLKHSQDAAFDREFNSMMISHHQQGVDMAHLLPEKTQRPELVQLGENIIRTQSAEIKQMQDWQKAWFKA